jgi:hypothetical protein
MMGMGPYAFARHIADYSKEMEVELKKINPTYSHMKAVSTNTELWEWLQSQFRSLVLKQGLKARSKRATAVCDGCEE